MDADERAGAVLAELDTIARDVCRYEFGLPIGSDTNDAGKRLVAVVADAIREAVDSALEAEREKWGKYLAWYKEQLRMACHDLCVPVPVAPKELKPR